MQTTGYVTIDGKDILILVRNKKYSRLLKLREAGRLGQHFADEEKFLSESTKHVSMLLSGKIIEL